MQSGPVSVDEQLMLHVPSMHFEVPTGQTHTSLVTSQTLPVGQVEFVQFEAVSVDEQFMLHVPSTQREVPRGQTHNCDTGSQTLPS